MLAGSEGLGGIDFDNASVAQAVGVVALALVLFSGGLDTRWVAVRPIVGRGILLATVGTLVTAGLVAGVVLLVTDLSLAESLLLGAVVSSTDAAAVFSVLRARRVRVPGAGARPPEEFESGSNDPMAVFLTVSLITVIAEGGGSPLEFAASFVLQMGLGALLGLVFGRGMAWAVSGIDLDHDGLYPVLSLALVLLAFGVTGVLSSTSFGFLLLPMTKCP